MRRLGAQDVARGFAPLRKPRFKSGRWPPSPPFAAVNPVWPVTWQRCLHLVRQHLDADQALPTVLDETVRQDEDLGR